MSTSDLKVIEIYEVHKMQNSNNLPPRAWNHPLLTLVKIRPDARPKPQGHIERLETLLIIYFIMT